MAIDKTYRKILTEDYILDELKKGEIPSAEDIQDKINSILSDLDLTKPMFQAEPFKAYPNSNSSASLLNLAQRSILADMRVLYKEMISLSETAVNASERWRLEIDALEKELIDLEDRIENLLLLTKDTEGYHSYIVDNFSDLSLVDRDLTTAFVDPELQAATLGSTGSIDTRIHINKIDPIKDISFKVRSTTDFVSRIDAIGVTLENIFRQTFLPWYTQISMTRQRPVTCELVIKLSHEPIKLNKIFIKLHQAARSSPMNITPLYSVDNFNFAQLPTNTYTQDVRSTAVFAFDEIEAKYIKFVLIKTGIDPVSNTDKAVYQFGFREIAFYREGFDTSETQTLISQPLSVVSASNPNERVEFSKLTMEVCERIETGTDIDYYVTVSDDPLVPVDTSTVWVPIAPITHGSPTQPKVLDVGNIEELEIGINEEVGISFTGDIEEDLNNPAPTFHLLSADTNNDGIFLDFLDEEITADEQRYTFSNENERILDYQIKDSDYDGSGTGSALTINEDNIVIFRNVGEKGLIETEQTSTVRGVQRGWRFEEPYYCTVIEVLNPVGLTIDFGDKSVIIDDVSYSNIVGPTILTGRTSTNRGIHTIKVHKDSWLSVTPELDDLDDIKAEDSLYPFNHKLLVEGYDYPTSYSNDQEKIYKGVDLFASELMIKASIFDFTHSIARDAWEFFALDRDAANTHEDGNEATRVFVIKTDDTNGDFSNERFVLRFNQINQRYKYLRLKAVFTTTSDKVAPLLDSYKIKLGG